jgi:hypothetical protein
MAGASTPANPGTPTTAPACDGTPRPGPATVIECRSRATGQEAEFLAEAAQRLEAVSSLLAGAALGHVGAGDLVDAVTPLVAVLDDAARYVHLAGQE